MTPASLGRALWRSLSTAWTSEPWGPPWSPWAWTMVMNTLIAVLTFTLGRSSNSGFGDHLLISQCIGLSIHGLFAGLGRLLQLEMFELPWLLRLAYVMGVVLAGSWFGFSVGMLIVVRDPAAVMQVLGRASGNLVALPLAYAAIMVVVFTAVGRWRARQLAAARAQSEWLRADREAIAARLALLNAQIEPHFLYNTLAHVRALTGRDPRAAQRMIDSLIEYLRASSRALSRPLIPLGEEIESVRGYLAVMQQRLGERLRVDWEVPDEALGAPLPPAALQTLVENAIKHGIEPSADGGRIRVCVARQDDRWQVDVENTGSPLDAGARPVSGGTGLANLRERLRLALGADAALSLQHEVGQTRARMILVEPATTDLRGPPLG